MNNRFVKDNFPNEHYGDTNDMPNNNGNEYTHMGPTFSHHRDDKYKQFGREIYNDKDEYSHRQKSNRSHYDVKSYQPQS